MAASVVATEKPTPSGEHTSSGIASVLDVNGSNGVYVLPEAGVTGRTPHPVSNASPRTPRRTRFTPRSYRVGDDDAVLLVAVRPADPAAAARHEDQPVRAVLAEQ